MILGAEIGLLVAAIITLVQGKLTLTGGRAVYGTPARVLALVGMLPLPLSCMIGTIVGFVQAAGGQPVNMQAFSGTAIVIEVSVLGCCLAAVYGIGYALAGPPVAPDTRKRGRQWDNEPAPDSLHDDRPGPDDLADPLASPEVVCPICGLPYDIPTSPGRAPECRRCRVVFDGNQEAVAASSAIQAGMRAPARSRPVAEPEAEHPLIPRERPTVPFILRCLAFLPLGMPIAPWAVRLVYDLPAPDYPMNVGGPLLWFAAGTLLVVGCLTLARQQGMTPFLRAGTIVLVTVVGYLVPLALFLLPSPSGNVPQHVLDQPKLAPPRPVVLGPKPADPAPALANPPRPADPAPPPDNPPPPAFRPAPRPFDPGPPPVFPGPVVKNPPPWKPMPLGKMPGELTARHTLPLEEKTEPLLAFSPDGKSLATAVNADAAGRMIGARPVRVWDLETRAVRKEWAGCAPVAFTPDNNMFLYTDVGLNGEIRGYDFPTKRTLHLGGGAPFTLLPDGATVLSATRNEVTAFDLRRPGQAGVRWPPFTWPPQPQHRPYVYSMVVAPGGGFVAVTLGDVPAPVHRRRCRVLYCDIRSGDVIKEFNTGLEAVAGFVYTPDGSRFLHHNGMSDIFVRDAATGKEVRAFRHAKPVAAFALTPDGAFLAVADWDGLIRGYDLDSGQLRSEVQLRPRIKSLAFAPDGLVLAVGITDPGSVHLYDTQSVLKLTAERAAALKNHPAAKPPVRPVPGPLLQEFEPTRRPIDAMYFHPDGQTLAVMVNGLPGAMIDLSARQAWPLDAKFKTTIKGNVYPAHVRALAFSPNGRWMVTLTSFGTVALCDARTGAPQMILAGGVKADDHWDEPLQFSGDGRYLVHGEKRYGKQPKRLFVIDAHTGQAVSEIQADFGYRAARFDRQGKKLMVLGAELKPTAGSQRLVVRLFDVQSGKQIEDYRPFGGIDTAPDPYRQGLYAVSDDLRRIAVVELQRSTLRVWDLQAPRELGPQVRGPQVTVFAKTAAPTLAWLGDSKVLIRYEPTGRVIVRDVDDGRDIAELQADDGVTGVRRLAVSPDRAVLATSCNGRVRLWNLAVVLPPE